MGAQASRSTNRTCRSVVNFSTSATIAQGLSPEEDRFLEEQRRVCFVCRVAHIYMWVYIILHLSRYIGASVCIAVL
jgi:hypothetical protein